MCIRFTRVCISCLLSLSFRQERVIRARREVNLHPKSVISRIVIKRYKLELKNRGAVIGQLKFAACFSGLGSGSVGVRHHQSPLVLCSANRLVVHLSTTVVSWISTTRGSATSLYSAQFAANVFRHSVQLIALILCRQHPA